MPVHNWRAGGARRPAASVSCGGAAPVDDVQRVHAAERGQQRRGKGGRHAALVHGAALAQQQVQQVAARAELHDQVDVRTVLAGAVEARHQRHPARAPPVPRQRGGARTFCTPGWRRAPQRRVGRRAGSAPGAHAALRLQGRAQQPGVVSPGSRACCNTRGSCQASPASLRAPGAAAGRGARRLRCIMIIMAASRLTARSLEGDSAALSYTLTATRMPSFGHSVA